MCIFERKNKLLLKTNFVTNEQGKEPPLPLYADSKKTQLSVRREQKWITICRNCTHSLTHWIIHYAVDTFPSTSGWCLCLFECRIHWWGPFPMWAGTVPSEWTYKNKKLLLNILFIFIKHYTFLLFMQKKETMSLFLSWFWMLINSFFL